VVHEAISAPITASVLMPVYNASRYLERAVDSVLVQSCREFELILIDDGSVDDSLRILEGYAGRDPRCRVISRENRGIVETLNEGIRLARAEIILRMDSDDICRNQRFARQIAYLHGHPECVAVGSRVLLIDSDGLPIREMIDRYAHEEIDAANLLGGGSAICHPTAAIRTQALRDIGGYRQGYLHAEDIDLFLRLAEIGRLANLSEVLLDYRQHIASIGYRDRGQQEASISAAIREASTRRGLDLSAYPAAGEDSTPQSLGEAFRKWAWWALQAGHLPTARKYAVKAAMAEPLNPNGWKLMACVLRGH
jgi:glycosyltransferase involved in cell wall biosynthesis